MEWVGNFRVPSGHANGGIRKGKVLKLAVNSFKHHKTCSTGKQSLKRTST